MATVKVSASSATASDSWQSRATLDRTIFNGLTCGVHAAGLQQTRCWAWRYTYRPSIERELRSDDGFDELLVVEDLDDHFSVDRTIERDDAAIRRHWICLMSAHIGRDHIGIDRNTAWRELLDDHAGRLVDIRPTAVLCCIKIEVVVIGEFFALQPPRIRQARCCIRVIDHAEECCALVRVLARSADLVLSKDSRTSSRGGPLQG